MFFFSAISAAAALHNLAECLKELVPCLIEKSGVQLYALLMLLSVLFAVLGVCFMAMKKKSATIFLMSAAVICMAENLLGANPLFTFLWTFAYALSGGGCFYQINVGMKFPKYGFIRNNRELLEKTIGQLADTEKIMKDQKEWIIKINEFMKIYGALAYYAYVTLIIYCILTPGIYFYKYVKKLPMENIFYNSGKWTLLLFAVIVALGEIQRKYFIGDN